MTVPTPLPEPSQSPNWAAQLNAAITDRYEDAKQAAADVADTINTGRLSEDALTSTIDTRVSGGLGDLDGADTGPAGLAVLAAALPADARDALDITIDTSVGTAVHIGGILAYYHMPWRDISDLLTNGWTGGLYVTRDTTIVTLHLEDVTGGNSSILTTALPAGLLPDRYLSARDSVLDVGNTARRGWIRTNRVLEVAAPAPSLRFYGTFRFSTGPTLPATLPGAPA